MTLRQRRIEQCDKFANLCAKSPRFGHWFPRKTTRRSSRSGEIYMETFARCNRLANTPLFYMRRRLNGKQGKEYGARYRERREEGYVGGARNNGWKTVSGEET